MTILDYLLLGAFVVATVYTVCRLFIGWRCSAAAATSAHATDQVNGTNGPVNKSSDRRGATGWHSPETRNK